MVMIDLALEESATFGFNETEYLETWVSLLLLV